MGSYHSVTYTAPTMKFSLWVGPATALAVLAAAQAKRCTFNPEKKCRGKRPAGVPLDQTLQPARDSSGPLECYSYETLYPGVSYTIQSTNYPEDYPKRERCWHYFDVDESCEEPQFACDEFDVRGSGAPPKCKKSDKLMVYSELARRPTKFCGNGPVSFSVAGSSWMDFYFKSNGRDQGSGYSCQVSCGGTTGGPTEQSSEPATTTESGPTPSPGPCNCGLPNRVNRIVGGEDTEANEYPWQVGMISSFGSTPFCGGSLISSNTVLTAAHCTAGRSAGDVRVLVGEHDTSIEDGEFKVNVKQIIEHLDYDSSTTDNDYALLILEKSVEWTESVQPVCLPAKSSSAYENIEAIVSGWGTTSFGGQLSTTLQEVKVDTMTNGECTSDDTLYEPGVITSNMICAAEKEGNGGKDACQGDSGGPLIAKESSESYSLIGVVSWGYGCAQADAPGVYSRVTQKLKWIQDNMQGTTCPAL